MLRNIFFLLILVPGLAAALASRFGALLLYIWFAMFRPDSWLWMDISAFRPSLVIGLLLVIPCLVTGTFPVLLHPLAIGSLVFLGAGGLAQLGALNSDLGMEWLSYLARLLIVSLLVAPLTRTPRRVLLVVGVLSGSLLFHSAKAGLMSVLSGGSQYSAGLAGAFLDSNGYSLGTAMAMFLFLGVAQNVRSLPLRWGMFLVGGPLSAMTIISLFSRGGLLALAAGAVVFVALQRGWRSAAAVVLVAGTVTLVLNSLPSGYVERVQPLTTQEGLTADKSAAGRLHFWSVALDMAVANPLGVGLKNFEEAYDRFDTSNGQYGHARSVHNSHLEALTEAGVIGLAAWTFVMAWTFRVLFRVRGRAKDERLPPPLRTFCSTMASGMLASMTAFVVGGSFIALALNDLTWITIGAVIALDRLTATDLVSEPVPPSADVPGPAGPEPALPHAWT